MGEEVNYPYYKIMKDHFEEKRIYSNQRSGGLEFVTECPWCNKEDKLWVNILTKSAKCWNASCEQHSNINNIYQLFSLFLKIPRKEAEKFVDEYLTEKDITKIAENKIEAFSKKSLTLAEARANQKIDVWFDSVTRITDNDEYYYNWLQEVRKPSWNPDWFLNRFKVFKIKQYVNESDFSHRNRAIFEITTKNNRAYLSYATKKSSIIKTLNPEGEVLSRMLFNYNDLEYTKDYLFVCEGIFSAARVIRAGFDAVCSFGVNMSEAQAILLNQTESRNIVFLYDYGAIEKARSNTELIIRNLDTGNKKYFYFEIPYYQEYVNDEGKKKIKGLDPDDLGTKRLRMELNNWIEQNAFIRARSTVGFGLSKLDKWVGG